MLFYEAWKNGVGAPLLFENEQGRISVPEQDYNTEFLESVQGSALRRLGAYRMQYWFRLFTVLQSQYSRLGALMGWEAFNPMTQRFLIKNKPQAHSLMLLGKSLAQWVEREYGQIHPEWVQAAQLDWAHQVAFYAPHGAPLTREGIGKLLVNHESSNQQLHCHASVSVVGQTVVWRLGRRIMQRNVQAGVARFLERLQSDIFWLEALAASIASGELHQADVPMLFENGVKNGWFVLGTL